jgi:protein-S-isoprenylcysteine O-methyltransferase Ste14
MSTTNNNIQLEHPKRNSNLARGVFQRGAQVLAILLFYAVLLFVSAGRLDWLAAWIYLGIYAVTVLINMTIILPKNPEFAAERGRVKEDAKGWDKQITSIAGVFMIAGLVVPGLDLRFGWSPQFAFGVQLAGFVVLALGYALFSWAMLSNEFFETKVRIQKDRGQTVATSGPYRYVRHPGYVGMILQLLATPIALSSWWGIIPALCATGVFILRTALEDKTLREELAGYQEYAQEVCYRLFPGVW